MPLNIPPIGPYEPTTNILLRAIFEALNNLSIASGGASAVQYNRTRLNELSGAGMSTSFSNFKKVDIVVVSGSTVTVSNGHDAAITLPEGMTLSLEGTSLMEDSIQINCNSADDRVLIIQTII